MRLIVTSDLHYNHAKSRPLAEAVIQKINRAEADALVFVGDTAAFDGDALERCLSLVEFKGARLFVAGNHELWTHSDDSHQMYRELLPARVRACGWHWLESDPWVSNDVALVGSMGWYDYSMAQPELQIPERFYEAKVSPGAAERLGDFQKLFEPRDDIPESAMKVVARWNDGRFVKLHRSDRAFLEELLDQLRAQLDALSGVRRLVALIHHLPFADLLPPSKSAQWDFAKAYLGSVRIGELLLRYPNLSDVYCGHSHFAAEATVGHIHAQNIGCGYRQKLLKVVEL